MQAILVFNFILSIVFTVCYLYQFFYVFVGLFKKPIRFKAKENHRYAVVICARNERRVIGNLIESVKNQTYPAELVDVFVVADNCTDTTPEVARAAGAIVYERHNLEKVGKGYALDWFFKELDRDYADKGYEAFIVFDADNVLDPHFIEEMNATFDAGYRIITSYRNSKNYDHNWITAGYSLWFLREAKFLNNSRMQLGNSCAISGTGFLVSKEIIDANGGWIHHLLTEDIEFTTDSIIKGEKIGYCGDAILYDEQPTTFRQSYFQRLRWAKGFYQVFAKYSGRLLKGACKGNFSCYDMLMTLMPAMLLTLVSIVLALCAIPICATMELNAFPMVKTLSETVLSFYLMFFLLGALTTITERKQIHCGKVKRVLYLFTFPLFMLTYIPISLIALFTKVEWKPIKHSVSITVDDIVSDAEPAQ